MTKATGQSLTRRTWTAAVAGSTVVLATAAVAQTSSSSAQAPAAPSTTQPSSPAMSPQAGKPDQATAMRMIEGWPEVATTAAKNSDYAPIEEVAKMTGLLN